MNALVIHHSADLDGICSREVARHFLGDTATYLGFDYGQPTPDLSPYDTIYLIDISLPVEVMRENAAKLILIDHHKTLIEAVAPFRETFKGYYCIDGVAACRLAWQFFQMGEPKAGYILPVKGDYTSIPAKVTEPRAVELLGRYDIWDKRDPDVDPFQLGMLAEKAPPWDKLLALPNGTTDTQQSDYQQIASIVQNGRVIQSFTEVMNAQIATERGFDVHFEGLLFRALNIARCNSMTFTAALKPEHDGCLAYFWNGKHWKFSLYGVPGKEHIDLSVIAKKHGGGGHKQACGFQLAGLPAELGGPTGGAQA